MVPEVEAAVAALPPSVVVAVTVSVKLCVSPSLVSVRLARSAGRSEEAVWRVGSVAMVVPGLRLGTLATPAMGREMNAAGWHCDKEGARARRVGSSAVAGE